MLSGHSKLAHVAVPEIEGGPGVPGVKQQVSGVCSMQPGSSHWILCGSGLRTLPRGQAYVAHVVGAEATGAGVTGFQQQASTSSTSHLFGDRQDISQEKGLRTRPKGQAKLAQVAVLEAPVVRQG